MLSFLILFTAYPNEGICLESIQPFKDFYCAEIRTDKKKKKRQEWKKDLLLGKEFVHAVSFMPDDLEDRLLEGLALYSFGHGPSYPRGWGNS